MSWESIQALEQISNSSPDTICQTGLKLVALWGPDHAAEIVQRHEGELFRRLSSLREMWCRRLGMDVEAFLRGSDSESCCTPYSALSLVPH